MQEKRVGFIGNESLLKEFFRYERMKEGMMNVGFRISRLNPPEIRYFEKITFQNLEKIRLKLFSKIFRKFHQNNLEFTNRLPDTFYFFRS